MVENVDGLEAAVTQGGQNGLSLGMRIWESGTKAHDPKGGYEWGSEQRAQSLWDSPTFRCPPIGSALSLSSLCLFKIQNGFIFKH